MSRAIDAEVLMQAMYHRAFETDEDTMWQSGCWVRYRAIEQTVKEQPTIEPERKNGEWVVTKTERAWNCAEYPTEVTCSNCGYVEVYSRKYNFCPNCGADMRGE